MNEVYIVAGKRSPIAKLSGGLADLNAADIGAQVIAHLLQELELDPTHIDEVIIGQVLTGGAGQNPARQAALLAGLAPNVSAFTVNKVCGGGQKSIHLAAQAIKAGDANLIIAGGQDSMSNAPQLIMSNQIAAKQRPLKIQDSMIIDGLWDAFHNRHMGDTVEHLITRWQISREEQDRFAHHSQLKADNAIRSNRFDAELTPIKLPSKQGDIYFSKDEHPYLSSLEKLARLKPAFCETGTITVGNASGLNDGAAAVLVASEQALLAANLNPIVRIASYASFALEPMDMGLGPIGATQKALRLAGWNIGQIELAEINEAFAGQSIIVLRELGIDPEIVNVNGGAIALGHPLAGSGCRIVVSLLHEMQRRSAKKGVATLCIGGGMGVAICLERC